MPDVTTSTSAAEADATPETAPPPDVDRLVEALNTATREKFDVRFCPFLVQWYNEKRDEICAKNSNSKNINKQLLDHVPGNTVGLVGYSGPDFFEKAVLPTYVANFKAEETDAGGAPAVNKASTGGHQKAQPVDAATEAVIGFVREFLRSQEVRRAWVGPSTSSDLLAEFEIQNTDLPPYRVHVQTLGCVAGLDEHVEPAEVLSEQQEDVDDNEEGYVFDADFFDELAASRDARVWGADNRTLHGVNLHPEFGGWYCYRLTVLFPRWQLMASGGGSGGSAGPSKWKPRPLAFLTKEEKREALIEFNLRPNLALWRDFRDASMKKCLKRYTALAYLYFHEADAKKRMRALELAAEAISIPS
mmetsp:Transcript_15807/g.39104  ORF Transcript_15807/g.39104 Transcript_15807/m.39104 type:complete len:360 (+) Transcript_15807:1840-2919(+)|eukprot:g15229.t1